MNVAALRKPDSREFEYWTPEPIFKGKTVFCLASGPSLTQAVADKIKGHCAITVNSSCRLASWADVLYFTDSGWYEKRRELVRDWPAHVISMSRTAKRELPDKVKRVQGRGEPSLPPQFPPLGSPYIQQGRTSGHTAISLAIALAANVIVCVGYDMRLVDGREHCHDEYQGEPRDLEQYARELVPAFAGWRAAAKLVGVEILNATPGSAITEFPFVNLDKVLTCDQS
jgi:hypothetical protein